MKIKVQFRLEQSVQLQSSLHKTHCFGKKKGLIRTAEE